MATISQSLKNIAKVAFGTLGSRLLGLLRDTLSMAYLGASAVSSSFFFGFTVPNLFRRLMGEGALSSAFIPIFTQSLRDESKEGAFDFLNKILSRAILILAFLVLLGVTISGAISLLGIYKFNSGDIFVLSSGFTAVMMPYMFFICLAALFCGALNVLGAFTLPALTAVWLNIAIIASIFAGGYFFYGSSLSIAKCMCAGVLLGGFAQFLIPAIELRTKGWRFKFDLGKSPQVSEFFKLFFPALLGASIIQINMLVANTLAIFAGDVAMSAIYISSRLVELPLGLFTFAIVSVYFPKLAMLSRAEQKSEYSKEFSKALISLMFICIPASFGLIALSDDILKMLFQWGKFGSGDVEICSPILAISALGIPFYSIATFSSRSFHSIKDTRTPVKIAFIAFIINFAISLALIKPYGARGLVAANVASGIFQAASLFLLFNKRRACERISLEILKILAAASAMFALVYALKSSLNFGYLSDPKLHSLILCAIAIPLAVAFYVAILYTLKFREFATLRNLLKRKVK